MNTCTQCGASLPDGSCDERFAVLLALDHSRQEPWGSRHGLAFAVFTLQHSAGVEQPVLQNCWVMLSRVYEAGDDRQDVVNGMRNTHRAKHGKGYARSNTAHAAPWNASPLPDRKNAPHHYATTIATLGDFEASTYPERLDAWCVATLNAWISQE